MIERGFIQRQGNQKLRHEEQLVATALERRGIPFEFYTEKLINRHQLPLTRTSLVVGDMPCVYGAMKQLGIPIPAARSGPRMRVFTLDVSVTARLSSSGAPE